MEKCGEVSTEEKMWRWRSFQVETRLVGPEKHTSIAASFSGTKISSVTMPATSPLGMSNPGSWIIHDVAISIGYLKTTFFTPRYGCTQLWIISHYHPYGSLYDFLQAHVVDTIAAIRLAKTAAAGLCYLHSCILGLQVSNREAFKWLSSIRDLFSR